MKNKMGMIYLQEDDHDLDVGHSESDAEFEQMLAEADEPKVAPTVAEESCQQKEEDPNLPVSLLLFL